MMNYLVDLEKPKEIELPANGTRYRIQIFEGSAKVPTRLGWAGLL
jgi:hypothetical protein